MSFGFENVAARWRILPGTRTSTTQRLSTRAQRLEEVGAAVRLNHLDVQEGEEVYWVGERLVIVGASVWYWEKVLLFLGKVGARLGLLVRRFEGDVVGGLLGELEGEKEGSDFRITKCG